MSGFTYSIIFNLQNTSAVVQATSVTNTLDNSVNRLTIDINQSGRAMTKMGTDGSSAFAGLQSKAAQFLATLGAMRFGYDSLQTAAKFESIEKAIMFSSAGEGQKNINFLNKTVDDLGLNLMSTMEGFKLWQGSLMNTSLQGEKGRQIFRAVAEATAAMSLSGEDSKGVFLALSQIMSKGKVSAEELRGQLAERVPGALNLAAMAMGVTTSEISKMLDEGKLMSDDFLPKLANQLHNTFSGQAIAQANGATGSFNSMGNELLRLKKVIGEELMPTAINLIKNWLIPSVKWVGENIELIGLLGTTILSLYGAAKIYAGAMAIKALATATFTGTIWGLNAAMLANPAVWLAGLVIALGAAAVYAWNKFEGFRGFLFGMGAAIKETGFFIYDFLIKPLIGFGKTIVGVLSFNKNLIATGIADIASTFQQNLFERGKQIGAAYGKGFKEGINDFKSDQQLAPLRAMTNEMMEGFGVKSKFFMQTGNPGDAKSNAITSAFTRGGGTTTTNPLDDPKIKSGITSITSGGSQTKHININLRNLVENLTVQSQNIREGAEEIRDILSRELLQVLNTSNQMQ